MIDPQLERLITLAEVPRLNWLPIRRGGKRLHLSTVYRWVQRGLRGVRLETIQFGGTQCTTEAALLRFFQSLRNNPRTEGTNLSRCRQSAIAKRVLDAAGI
jgi:hypothetical protein